MGFYKWNKIIIIIISTSTGEISSSSQTVAMETQW